jgi:hypothetical protein
VIPTEIVHVFHARSQLEDVRYVDHAPQGQSPGDVLVFTERLLDGRGRRIGSDAATQAVTGGTERFAHSTGTVTVEQRPSGDRFTFRIRTPRRGGSPSRP